MNASYEYQYNTASQRVRMTLADGSYWIYSYDALGQVRSGKRYWRSGAPVAGQQFEYAHDDIGNRTETKVGGDEDGENLRNADYSVNSVNQYTSRSTTNKVDILGIANPNAVVEVNGQTADRHGEYFRYELSGTGGQINTVTITNVSDPYSDSGKVFFPPASESYSYDDDGNLEQDARWDYDWDAENRLVTMTKRADEGFAEKIEFEYDWRGRRIGKKVYDDAGSGTPDREYVYLYDGWNLIAELDGNHNEQRTYIWGLDMSEKGVRDDY